MSSGDEVPLLPSPAEKHRRALSKEERAAFLLALSNGWSVRHAALHAGRNWRLFYKRRDRDAAFAAAWQDAVEAGTDVLEHEARRRAVDGVEKPVYQGGQLVGMQREYSDRLLEFLLRGRRPGTYRDAPLVNVSQTVVAPQHVAEGVARLNQMLTIARQRLLLDGDLEPPVIDEHRVFEGPPQLPQLPPGGEQT